MHCTGASRALEPHGQVPLRIAANLRPTQLVKRMVQNFKQEVAAAETPLAHTLWACRPPPAGTLAHCPADTSLYWVLAKMITARETNSAPIHSSNRVQNLIKVQRFFAVQRCSPANCEWPQEGTLRTVYTAIVVFQYPREVWPQSIARTQLSRTY